MTSYNESTVWTNDQIALWRAQLLEALQISAFRQWLTEFPPNCTVGYANQVKGCPIKRYVDAVLPHLDAMVGKHQLWVNLPQFRQGFFNFSSGGGYDLYYLGALTLNYPGGAEVPVWVKGFTTAIDDRFMRQHPDYKCWSNGQSDIDIIKYPWTVTAAGAIEVLDGITLAAQAA